MKSALCSVFMLFLLVACVKQTRDTSCQGCQQTSIKDFEKQHEDQFTAAMQYTLEQLFNSKAAGIDDPDKLKAMKVLAKTDAAKSYAFTQIYAVAAKYCDKEVASLLKNYQLKAADIISLGKYYYHHGIQAKLGDRDFSQSGAALTEGLKEMTDQLEQEHQTANEQQLVKKCSEAKTVLGSLIFLYGSH